MSHADWRDFVADLVPDADVSSFGQKQLHLVHVLVFCRPDHGCPASIILKEKKCNKHRPIRHTFHSLLLQQLDISNFSSFKSQKTFSQWIFFMLPVLCVVSVSEHLNSREHQRYQQSELFFFLVFQRKCSGNNCTVRSNNRQICLLAEYETVSSTLLA